MMRAPDLAEIQAAELKVVQSLRETCEGARRVRVAFRAALARPATLAVAGGAGVLAGFWFGRRTQPRPVPRTAGAAAAAAAPSAAGVLLAFAVRHGMQRLPSIIQQLWDAHRKPVPAAGPAIPPTAATVHRTSGTLHVL